MNKMLVIVTSVFFILFAGAANAVDEHHPADAKPAVTSSSPPSSPPAKAATGQSVQEAAMPIQQMEQMMQKMQRMHDDMMAAKTPAERQKLMDEYSKFMENCKVMMKTAGGNDGAMMNGKGTPAMMMNRETGSVPMAR